MLFLLFHLIFIILLFLIDNTLLSVHWNCKLYFFLLNVVSCREYGLFNHVDAEKWEKGRGNWIKLDQLNLTCFSKNSIDIPFLFSKKTLFISPIKIVHRHLDIIDHQDQSNFLQKDILRLKYWFNYPYQLYLYLPSR